MRTAFSLLTAFLALLIAAAPVQSHQGKGSHGRGNESTHGPQNVKWIGRVYFSALYCQNNPTNRPGIARWAPLCKKNHPTGWARRLCVAQHARTQGLDLDHYDG